MKVIAGVAITVVAVLLLLWVLSSSNTSTQTGASSADWQIVQVQSRITAKDSSGTTFGWKVTISNDSDAPAKFLDKDGFEIEKDYFNLSEEMPVDPHSARTFSGSTFLYNQQNADGVAKVTATARRE
jgi:hypothetical protein